MHKGFGLSLSCSEIGPKTVQKNLKDLVDYLEKASKIEQALALKRYIKDILYSKESIQINILCHPQLIDRQSIKNPAPLFPTKQFNTQAGSRPEFKIAERENVQACGWVGWPQARRFLKNLKKKALLLAIGLC